MASAAVAMSPPTIPLDSRAHSPWKTSQHFVLPSAKTDKACFPSRNSPDALGDGPRDAQFTDQGISSSQPLEHLDASLNGIATHSLTGTPSDQADLPSWTALDVSDNSSDNDQLNLGVTSSSNNPKKHSTKSIRKQNDQLHGPAYGTQSQASLSTSRPLLLPYNPFINNNTVASNTVIHPSNPPPSNLSFKTRDAPPTTREPLFLPDDHPSPTESANSFSFGPTPKAAFSSVLAMATTSTKLFTTPPTTPNAMLTAKASSRTSSAPNSGIRRSFAGVVITKPPPHKNSFKFASKFGLTRKSSVEGAAANGDVESNLSDVAKPPRSTTPSTSQSHRRTPTLSNITVNESSSDSGRRVAGIKPRSSLLGVVITKPPPSPSKLKTPGPENGLAAALTRAFIQNDSTLTGTKSASTNTAFISPNRARPHQAREAKYATTARTAKIASAMRPITQSDIDAYLGLTVGKVAMPAQGSKYDPWQWEEDRIERTAMNVRFFRKDWEANIMRREGEAKTAKERVNVIPTKSRTETFVGYLEAMFGPGSIHRGWGTVPKQKRRNGDNEPSRGPRPVPSGSVSRGGSFVQEEIGAGIQIRKRPWDGDDEQPHKKAKLVMDVDMAMAHVDDAGWMGAIQKLVKGKTNMDEEDMKKLSNVLDEINGIKDNLKDEVLQKTRLGEVVEQLAKMKESEIPFGDAGRLRRRASIISEFWRAR